MKKTLLPLSLAMLLGASMQAQTTGVVAPNEWNSNEYPCNMNQSGYSGSETVYNSVALENATGGLETFTISQLVYSTQSGTAPSSGEGELTLYYMVSTSEVTAPIPARVMKEVFNGTVSAEDFDGGNLALTLNEPIVMHKGENLVVGFVMNVTSTNLWNWAIGYKDSSLAKSWAYSSGPIDFTTTGSSVGDYPALSIVYTEGEGGETPVENAFEAEITNAVATRSSATDAEVSVTYNVTKQENVVGYKFEVVDAAGNVLGSSEVKAGVRGEETIELTLPNNNAAVAATVKMNAVYTDETASDPITYELTIPEYISTPTGVDIVSADNGEAVYYNLQGVRVANPENGLYIRVQNGKAQKVTVK